MKKKQLSPELDRDYDENPEWTEETFARARPASEVLPELFGAEVAREMLRPRGRPPLALVKERITIRVDADILQAFRATGRGWQTRVNDAMREWLREHSAS